MIDKASVFDDPKWLKWLEEPAIQDREIAGWARHTLFMYVYV
jgi:hypothetical protein